MPKSKENSTEEKKDWPFTQPRRSLVLTNTQVIEGVSAVYYVSHDEGDGIWQFHAHEDVPTKEEDVRLAPLKELYYEDESLGLIADLPTGWHAWRDSLDEEWKREKME